MVKTDGEVLRGASAIIFVYDVLGYPGVTVGLWRPFIWGLDAGYDVVANNRRVFSRFIFRNE